MRPALWPQRCPRFRDCGPVVYAGGMPDLPFSPACERNKSFILPILRATLVNCRHVLEVGSGTGQHAVYFAAALDHLQWQPSELPAHLAGLRARIIAEGPPNCALPLGLDVCARNWPVAAADAIFTANTLHIMSWAEVEAFFAGAGRALAPAGKLCVYGPFRYGGQFTSPSNAAFDASLRARDPGSGVRDFEAVNELAMQQGLALEADHPMPANNQLLAWSRPGE